jgi:hypothetical protein
MDEDQVAPTIWRAEAGQVPARVSFSVSVTDDSGIERVVVTYRLGTPPHPSGRGDRREHWRSLDLSYDAVRDRWRGELTGVGETVSYFVQAIDMAGNVATSHNKGFFFEPVTYEVYLPAVIRGRQGADEISGR